MGCEELAPGGPARCCCAAPRKREERSAGQASSQEEKSSPTSLLGTVAAPENKENKPVSGLEMRNAGAVNVQCSADIMKR